MFQSTVAESFRSWEKFLEAYYEPIKTAIKLLPFVGAAHADDVAQSFFLKMYERGILDKRPEITGKFRNWLYVAARRHAIDEWRKNNRRPERTASPGDPEPADPGYPGGEEAPLDADLFYALSILHMTVARVPPAPAQGGEIRTLDDLRGAGFRSTGPGPRAQDPRSTPRHVPGRAAGLPR